MASTTTIQHNKDPPNVLHFSHPHPLEYTTSSSSSSSSSSSNNSTCFGCKLSFVHGESYYNCRPCSFSLHNICHKMPLITKHPSHPNHDLVLLVMRPSPATISTLKCTACGNHVTGFCYHCAECSSIFFHTLCLALPLSISVTNHPHRMDLAFKPPYDFFCDLCNNKKPKRFNNGWLYRCSMCEFDTHIGCAVENIEPQSVEHPCFPQSNALMGKLHGNQGLNASFGDGTSTMIMRLVAGQIGCGGNRGKKEQHSCENRKLNSPRRLMQKATCSIGKNKLIELQETSSANFEAYLEEKTPLRDQSTPLSDTHTPSHQFSEAYFSIDLAKSYSASSAHDRNNNKKDIIGSDKKNPSVVPERTVVHNSDRSQGKKETLFGLVNLPSNNNDGLYNNNIENHQNKLNSGIFEGLGESKQKVAVKNSNESLTKRSIKDQTVPKSDLKRENRSGWKKCLPCF